ncbi:SGNH/GDSL hydrolase family protein [Sphingomonas sp. G-3-2-10]|uniref:SGNH/GDSL hydrolase family protein n=1 Tax=Sphingomonas sp. G-3-2-10 TaxID=2728838 RepID=UPI00146A80A6|nr:SGNH/GDSL hydrolase family protein [Sphingomonas sp. G-3-2-10]NML07803.1 SGNH/GDSL hydrolase family protein [Sphingomonas sp. G-3-2-10]
MRWIGKAALVAAALLLAGATSPEKWTPAWTASMWKAGTERQEVPVANATLRFSIRVGADGDRIRLRLSNEYGQALQIGAASVRVAGGKAVAVTFGRKEAAEIPARTVITTDPARLKLRQFDVVEVSLYLPGSIRLNTVHGAGGDKTLLSVPGNYTAATSFGVAARYDHRPLLAGVEVLGGKPRPVIVAFGDSITDNTGCAMDAVPLCRWGDVLARRLAAAGRPHVVVTQAISGNRVLSQGTGPSAVERFDRDVLSLPGVTHVVLLEGINDIGGSGRVRGDGSVAPTITAEQLIEGYRQLIARARARGIKVMGLTILPYQGAGYYSEAGEAMRVRVNEWMRTSGEFDAVFDLEKVVADPANPQRLDPSLHRGDFLHPDARGETKMGEAIPLEWFR